jgi:hypothetical protein
MAMQAPTRITIEVHPPDPDAGWQQPVVRVVPESTADGPVASPGSARPAVAAAQREDLPTPAAYEPGPCLCLDDEDCGADHANE